jgi:hypothetical protein
MLRTPWPPLRGGQGRERVLFTYLLILKRILSNNNFNLNLNIKEDIGTILKRLLIKIVKK